MNHGLLGIPAAKSGVLCSRTAAIGDEVEWRNVHPISTCCFGRITREISVEEFRESIGLEAWGYHRDIYLRIGRFWECTKD